MSLITGLDWNGLELNLKIRFHALRYAITTKSLSGMFICVLAHVYYSSIHCTRKGSAEALARPAFTEIDLPSLITHVRAEELDLACLIVALHRTEVSDRRRGCWARSTIP